MVTVIMVTVIRYTDLKNLEKLKPPLLIYGRRKTGKTFLAKSYFKNAEYFFVKRNRTIFWESKRRTLGYNELINVLEALEEKLVIIDEFHRLPEEFLDYLHMKQPKNIVLITSTLFLAKNILAERSPILGLFLEYRVDLIDERDILVNLSKYFKGSELLEKSVFMREPILLQWAEQPLFEVLRRLKLTVPALVGEVFLEEDRKLTERYEGILRAISCGKQTISKMTGYLYSRRLIDSQNPSLVKSYVRNLLEIGLIKRYREYGREKNYYLVTSPMIDLYFYLDEKYNYAETELSEKYFREKLPFYIEDFIRNLLAKTFNLKIFMIRKPDLEVDIALGDFRKLKLIGEVKWRRKIKREELRRIEENLNKFHNVRKILVTPDKSDIEIRSKDIEIWDTGDLLSLARLSTKNTRPQFTS